jgi:hypothetical protein
LELVEQLHFRLTSSATQGSSFNIFNNYINRWRRRRIQMLLQELNGGSGGGAVEIFQVEEQEIHHQLVHHKEIMEEIRCKEAQVMQVEEEEELQRQED